MKHIHKVLQLQLNDEEKENQIQRMFQIIIKQTELDFVCVYATGVPRINIKNDRKHL